MPQLPLREIRITPYTSNERLFEYERLFLSGASRAHVFLKRSEPSLAKGCGVWLRFAAHDGDRRTPLTFHLCKE
jgi:hypothetical protein